MTIKYIIPLLIAFTLNACKFEGPESGRSLDIGDANVTVTEAPSARTSVTYGDTFKLYHFRDENTVLLVRISNGNTDFTLAELSVNTFDEDESDSKIENWVVNQYSKSQVSAPSASVNELSDDKYTVNSSSQGANKSGDCGDEYNSHTVEFYIDNSTVTDVYSLASFTDSATVYIQTKGCD